MGSGSPIVICHTHLPYWWLAMAAVLGAADFLATPSKGEGGGGDGSAKVGRMATRSVCACYRCACVSVCLPACLPACLPVSLSVCWLAGRPAGWLVGSLFLCLSLLFGALRVCLYDSASACDTRSVA